MSKRKLRPVEPPPANPADYRLSESACAAIDTLVKYTFSPENQARLVLRGRIGDEAALRLEKSICPTATGYSRALRYLQIAKAYDSEVFLQKDDGLAPKGWPRKVSSIGSEPRQTACASRPARRAGEGVAVETPTSNTGVTEGIQVPQPHEAVSCLRLVVGTGRKSKVLEIPHRHGHNGQSAFVDWLHLTIGKETCDQYLDLVSDDDHEKVLALSYRLERIFGFGVTCKRRSGRDFYRESYDLGKGDEAWGYCCIGGQNETILIGLTGSGCAAAKPGWELRLVHWLEVEAERPKITRIDLAYDDYTGEQYNPEKGMADYNAGQYKCYRGNEPTVETIGSDWHRPKGKGRTLAVGLRASGKFCRIYEKGMQLGCKDSPWVRVEVEFKAVDRVLPFEMLLIPGQYLAGAYPALNWINETQDRVLTEKKQAVITYEKALEVVQHQYGHYLQFMLQKEGSAQVVLDKIMRDGKPRRLQDRDYRFAPEPLRFDRHTGLTEQEANSLLDAHLSGIQIPAAFFGHQRISDSFMAV